MFVNNKYISEFYKELELKVRSTFEERPELFERDDADQNKASLANYVHAYFQALTRSVNQPPDQQVETLLVVARIHALSALTAPSYGVSDMIREYTTFRDTVRDTLRENTNITPDEREHLSDIITHCKSEAIENYTAGLLRRQESIVVGLSHDLRNPLGAAKIAAEMIANDAPQFAGLAQKALRNVARADRLVQSFLDLSLDESGRGLRVMPTECHLMTLVNEVVDDLSAPGRVVIKSGGEDIAGIWDADCIRRALENLLGNAVKYASNEKPIVIKARKIRGLVTVRVQNYGEVIAAEDLPEIFDSFRRGSSPVPHSVKGWGIGLASVRAIAEIHGGSIEVQSSDDEGTIFTLALPIKLKR